MSNPTPTPEPVDLVKAHAALEQALYTVPDDELYEPAITARDALLSEVRRLREALRQAATTLGCEADYHDEDDKPHALFLRDQAEEIRSLLPPERAR